MSPKDALHRAVKLAGNASVLARKIGVKPQAIYQWERVPSGRVIAVEAASGVPREKLRPDLYPPPSARAAA